MRNSHRAKIFALVLLWVSDSARGMEAKLTTSLGQFLSPEEPAQSISFEPSLNFPLGSKTSLELYAFIDRPFDPYKNFAVPKGVISFKREVELFTDERNHTFLIPSLTLVEIDRWKGDGFRFRPSAALEWSREIFESFIVLLRVGPYLEISQFNQRTDGTELPRYGLGERIGITYKIAKRLTLDIRLLLEQKFTTQWRNDYATAEQISYQVTDTIVFGVGHKLESSLVDDSTGFYSPISFFDGRRSRVSLFFEVRI